MVKVDSSHTLRDLTGKFMKVNRARNRIAIFAVMLTCLLFTGLFTGTVSMILSKRAADSKSFMQSSHAIVQDLTQEEYQRALPAVEKNKDVKRYGTGIFLGSGMDGRFGFSTEVRCADANLAESFNQLPTQGRLPKQEDEVATGTFVLDALGVPHQVGAKVTLSYEQNPVTGEIRTDTFRLCGYWESDPAVTGQMVWVSESYAVKNRYPASQKDMENRLVNGGYDIAVWYQHAWDISGKSAALSKECGLLGTRTHRRVFEGNPAYGLLEEDAFPFGTVFVMILVIVLAGYLIIYNIFSISVKTDLRAYGLLKNIGTTGKQLKKIVRMQVFYLALAGIPWGLFAGYLLGVWMSPSLAASAEISTESGVAAKAVVSANPLIFIIAALLTLFTVYLSAMQSCRLVGKASPVEALRMAEDDASYRKFGKVKKPNRADSGSWLSVAARDNCLTKAARNFGRSRGKGTHPDNDSWLTKAARNFGRSRDKGTCPDCYSWLLMAARNFGRNLRKGILVILSIALSLVVMDCIIMLVQGYDFRAYQEAFLAAEFQIDQLPATKDKDSAAFERVTPKMRKTLKACPYSEGIGYVYCSQESHAMEPMLRKAWEAMARACEKDWTDGQKKAWEQADASGEIRVHFMGINREVFHKLEWLGKPCTWEDFKTGSYVLVDYNILYAAQPVSYYHIGDAFAMQYNSGKKKGYTVLGEAALPYALDYPYFDPVYLTVFVPEEEFLANTGIEGAMRASIDCEKGQRKAVRQYLEDTLLKENGLLHMDSSLDLEESFQRYISKYLMVGTALALVLVLIGTMNFFNTVAASMISRRREFALLEAVGMTKAQGMRMFLAEGCLYLAGAELAAVLIICTCSRQLLLRTLGAAWFFDLHLTLWPCFVLLPVWYLVVHGVVRYQFGKMNRESVVERIRNV